MINEKVQKMKDHIVEHKEAYITGTICLIAGYTLIIMRGRSTGLQSGPADLQSGSSLRSLNLFANGNTNNIVQVIEREGRGHPGYLVRCIETGKIFKSQGEACDVMHISPSNLSSHLQGKFPDIYGLHFERLITKRSHNE